MTHTRLYARITKKLVGVLSVVSVGAAAMLVAPPLLSSEDGTPPNDSLVAPIEVSSNFAHQPRIDELRQQTPPQLEYTPGSTDWQPATLALSAEITTPTESQASSPGILLYSLMLELGWAELLGSEVAEHTTRVHQLADGHAIGVVLCWGLKDDAIAGQDLWVEMRQSGGVWYVKSLSQRFHCRRGVTDDGLCL